MGINEITKDEANEIMDKYSPRGLYYFFDNGLYIGIDNSSGDAWVEEFKSKQECIDWLKDW
ncbi:hypothetical protein P9E76_01615 [Schinkia azotoformans]|uniref:Uncharacterized protein n=1 Tax=Schinkia azotoformans LMG 9581 TaxID=1131731 RepID=K6DIB5_SCHAZ|nr:hypothetical protein [Schinkia azotoformans]EKN67863.1 hypothetical protein BAZO_08274 [Schinkia azotoformans LMG 9581]MEC1637372.1 hypothetical protein [Schinkia azotoformans]MEC1943776.1 hypothetical protein [Schinkia azotoformans]